MQMKRPPIIVVMGSVDHGKTTLLDYIRKTNVAAREAGGITQSVGAYEIEHNGQRLTFIDTPGHEAFSKMRQRGAKGADIAIIVVAADDGVKPQTKEAIKIAEETETPFIVAINKIDRSNADIQRTKNDLMQAGVLLEGYGGNITYQEISAKTGQGINELLDLVLLAADVEGLTCDPAAAAEGFILEAKLDSRRGPVATAIVKNGALKTGDYIKAGGAFGKIKSLENFLGKKITSAVPSAPVVILGFEKLPKVGEIFTAGADLQPETAEMRQLTKKNAIAKPMATKEKNIIGVILKADVSGSLEALSEVMRYLPLKNNHIEIIDESVGDVSDGDVKTAVAAGAVIVVFKAGVSKAAETLARAQNVKIIQSDIIYDLTKALEEQLAAGPKYSGRLEILAIFGKKGGKHQIIGGKVVEGEIKNNSALGIERRGEIIGVGRIINLQQNRKDVPKVSAGSECGLLFEADAEIKIGDILLAQ